jgi:class 3 adenylate cyclase
MTRAELEPLIGRPSTGDMQRRVGLHSGPVIVGVMKGAQARFRLFGDTVNTVSRMETSGCAGRIHATAATSQLLEQAGEGRWLAPREDTDL